MQDPVIEFLAAVAQMSAALKKLGDAFGGLGGWADAVAQDTRTWRQEMRREMEAEAAVMHDPYQGHWFQWAQFHGADVCVHCGQSVTTIRDLPREAQRQASKRCLDIQHRMIPVPSVAARHAFCWSIRRGIAEEACVHCGCTRLWLQSMSHDQQRDARDACLRVQGYQMVVDADEDDDDLELDSSLQLSESDSPSLTYSATPTWSMSASASEEIPDDDTFGRQGDLGDAWSRAVNTNVGPTVTVTPFSHEWDYLTWTCRVCRVSEATIRNASSSGPFSFDYYARQCLAMRNARQQEGPHDSTSTPPPAVAPSTPGKTRRIIFPPEDE